MIAEQEQIATVDLNSKLARMLLQDAINDILIYPSGTSPYLCARLWLFEECEEEENEFVSLDMVCHILELDINKIRIRTNICLDRKKRRLLNSEMDKFVDECMREKIDD